MSTKIYNGYRFKKNYDIRTLQKVCLRISNTITPLAYKEYIKMYYSIYFKIIDYNIFGIYDETMYFIGKKGQYIEIGVEKYIRKRMQSHLSQNKRDPSFDFDFSINILPIKNKVLLLLYCENNMLTKAFNEYPLILDYHYQDQTDKPKKISNKSWEQRKKDWNEALGGDGYANPNQVGFLYKPYETISFTDMYSLYGLTDADVEKLFPSIDERIKQLAKTLHYSNYCKKHPIDPSITDAEDKYDYWNKIFWQYDKYLETDKGKADREAINKKIKAKLPEIKKVKDLRDKYQSIKFHTQILSEFEKNFKPYWLKND